jgi:hypothetical protein
MIKNYTSFYIRFKNDPIFYRKEFSKTIIKYNSNIKLYIEEHKNVTEYNNILYDFRFELMMKIINNKGLALLNIKYDNDMIRSISKEIVNDNTIYIEKINKSPY